MFENKTIIVLGGNGFLGRNLCSALYKNNLNPIILDKTLGCNLAECSGQNVLKNILDNMPNNENVDVVMMAANLGAKKFETNPVELYKENKAINEKCLDTLLSSNKKLHISFYSTSEIYGNIDPKNIPQTLMPTVNPSYSRSLYALEKLTVEAILNNLRSTNAIASLRIFRPFNVSGKWQRRGVVYEMVKSAVQSNKICYARDQTREITFVADATKSALDAILARNGCEGTFDLTSRYHMYLKDLALHIRNALRQIDSVKWSAINIETMPFSTSYIYTRGTVPVIESKQDLAYFKIRLRNIVKDIVDQL